MIEKYHRIDWMIAERGRRLPDDDEQVGRSIIEVKRTENTAREWKQINNDEEVALMKNNDEEVALMKMIRH